MCRRRRGAEAIRRSEGVRQRRRGSMKSGRTTRLVRTRTSEMLRRTAFWCRNFGRWRPGIPRTFVNMYYERTLTHVPNNFDCTCMTRDYFDNSCPFWFSWRFSIFLSPFDFCSVKSFSFPLRRNTANELQVYTCFRIYKMIMLDRNG